MCLNSLEKKINRRKQLLNLCLNFMSPTNFFVIKLSENLDKLVVKYQKHLLKNYLRKRSLWKSKFRVFNRNIA